jgi:hypothetical protein
MAPAMNEPVHHCLEDMQVVLIEESTVAQIESSVRACERCAANAMTSLDYLIDALTGHDPAVTEYIMCRSAKCPSCFSELTETTLVAV